MVPAKLVLNGRRKEIGYVLLALFRPTEDRGRAINELVSWRNIRTRHDRGVSLSLLDRSYRSKLDESITVGGGGTKIMLS